MVKKCFALGLTAILAVLVFSGGGASAIVGGVNASKPLAVSLQSVNEKGEGYHECGGTLVAPQWVMTAAHCEPYIRGLARTGSVSWSKGESAKVVDVVVHPDYVAGGDFGYDIALARLDKPMKTTPFPLGKVIKETTALIAGWGTTCDIDINDPACREATPDLLKQVDMRWVPGEDCTLKNAEGVNLFYEKTMLCSVAASGKPEGPCFGDSGSPVWQHQPSGWKVVGIHIADMDSTTAHPNLCSTAPGGGTNHAGATNVEPFLPWINSVISPSDSEPLV